MKIANIIIPIAISTIIAAFSPVMAADAVKIIEVENLQQTGKQADEKRLPILLMFSAEGCGYCIRVEEEFLKPMLRSGDYEDKALIRKLKIDDFAENLVDFKGNRVTPAEFAERYKVFVTPTVVFIDGSGVELSEKRVGLMTPDYYGGYLDQSIDDALNILRRDKPMRVKLSSLNN